MERKEYVLEVLFTLLFLMGFLGNAFAEKMIRIANVDNFILHKHLKKGLYLKDVEKALDNVTEKRNILGTSWKNKGEICQFSLAEKTLVEPDLKTYGWEYLGVSGRVKEVVNPHKNSGWTDVNLLDPSNTREILLEIKGGGDGEPYHQQVGNIGIKRPDGIIEDIPLNEKNLIDKKKGSVLVLSDDYFYAKMIKTKSTLRNFSMRSLNGETALR